jgi:hypothetical protein
MDRVGVVHRAGFSLLGSCSGSVRFGSVRFRFGSILAERRSDEHEPNVNLNTNGEARTQQSELVALHHPLEELDLPRMIEIMRGHSADEREVVELGAAWRARQIARRKTRDDLPERAV